MFVIADALSLLRALAIGPVFYLSWQGEWKWALVALALGWATDPFDGLVADRWGSLQTPRADANPRGVFKKEHPDFDADGMADSVLAFGSTLVPAIYITAHHGYGWVMWVVYAATVILAGAMVAVMKNDQSPLRHWLIAVNMTASHGLVQIVATLLWFAYMADGKSAGAWTLASAIGLTVVTVHQRHKVALWISGELEEKEVE